MQVTEDFGPGGHIITAYSDKFVRINQREYRQSLILTPENIIENWCDCRPEALTIDHFAQLDDHGLDLIVFGAGAELVFPQAELMQHFLRRGTGFEVMDSGAACRTYNVLLSEGRRVAAAILLAE